MTLRQRELIDAPSIGCDHETSFPFRGCRRGTSLHSGSSFSATDPSHSQIGFLRSACVYAAGRPGNVALGRINAPALTQFPCPPAATFVVRHQRDPTAP